VQVSRKLICADYQTQWREAHPVSDKSRREGTNITVKGCSCTRRSGYAGPTDPVHEALVMAVRLLCCFNLEEAAPVPTAQLRNPPSAQGRCTGSASRLCPIFTGLRSRMSSCTSTRGLASWQCVLQTYEVCCRAAELVSNTVEGSGFIQASTDRATGLLESRADTAEGASRRHGIIACVGTSGETRRHQRRRAMSGGRATVRETLNSLAVIAHDRAISH
jgi:hypothetical protein